MTNYMGPGRYRHYKGGEYYVLGQGLKEDDHASYVIYGPMTPGSFLEQRVEQWWLRPLDDFNAQVKDDGVVVPRFKKVMGGANL